MSRMDVRCFLPKVEKSHKRFHIHDPDQSRRLGGLEPPAQTCSRVGESVGLNCPVGPAPSRAHKFNFRPPYALHALCLANHTPHGEHIK